MKINKSNYEAYFLDYIEGNLSEEQRASLMAFLDKNPGLKKELEGFENIKISEPPQVEFPDKNSLKVPEVDLPVTEENFEWFCIAKLENDLSPEEEQQLNDFLKQNPEKQKDYELYSKTVLEPAEDVVFENPNILKRAKITPISTSKNLWTYAAAAAVVFIIAGLFFMLPQPESENDKLIAEKVVEKSDEKDEKTKDSKEEIIEYRTPERELAAVSHPKEEQKQPAKTDQKEEQESTIKGKVPAIEQRPLLAERIIHQHNIELTPAQAEYSTTREQFLPQRTVLPEAGQQTYSSFAQAHPAHHDDPAPSSLMQLALDDFQQRSNINVRRVSAWDVAGAGLARISEITGTPLTVEQERDQEGRIVQFALGDRFSISRR